VPGQRGLNGVRAKHLERCAGPARITCAGTVQGSNDVLGMRCPPAGGARSSQVSMVSCSWPAARIPATRLFTPARRDQDAGRDGVRGYVVSAIGDADGCPGGNPDVTGTPAQ